MLFGPSAILITVAVLLGGGTHAGFIGDVLIQILAIPLLMACAWSWLGPAAEGEQHSDPRTASRTLGPWLIVIVATVALLIVVQLTPLPDGVWRRLVAMAWALPQMGAPGGEEWRPLSLTPHATSAAALSILTPLTVFWAVSSLGLKARLQLSWLVLALGVGSLGLGFLQVAQGADSPLRFFEFTNPTEAVGFFANRNHFAALLYVSLVLAGVLFTTVAGDPLQSRALDGRAAVWLSAALALLVALMAGLVVARSRAGLLLTLAAVAGIAAMILVGRRSRHDSHAAGRASVGRISLAAIGFATLFALQFGLHRILTRFDVDPLTDLRVPFAITTLEAARQSLPFGTGLGSFVSVYATAEKPAALFGGYVNRAHNDLAELLLETGLIGAFLLLVFLGWFIRRATTVWFRSAAFSDPAQTMLERAATLIIALLLAHSLVDYPLRTTALAVVFAFACAVLTTPPPSRERDRKPSGGERARRKQRSTPSH
jgi:O-antigen ligase